MKPDERQLLRRLAELQPGYGKRRPPEWAFATDVGVALGMAEKRAAYVLDKWAGKGWWEYGVSLRTGWLTPEGFAAARGLAEQVEGQ